MLINCSKLEFIYLSTALERRESGEGQVFQCSSSGLIKVTLAFVRFAKGLVQFTIYARCYSRVTYIEFGGLRLCCVGLYASRTGCFCFLIRVGMCYGVPDLS